MPSRTMRIGQLARHIGTTPRALRHYEQQGLLTSDRLANGYRVYDDTAINQAENIKSLFDVGLTSDDIRPFLDNGCLDRPLAQTHHCEYELGAIHSRITTLDELIARLESVRARLTQHAATVEASLTARR